MVFLHNSALGQGLNICLIRKKAPSESLSPGYLLLDSVSVFKYKNGPSNLFVTTVSVRLTKQCAPAWVVSKGRDCA